MGVTIKWQIGESRKGINIIFFVAVEELDFVCAISAISIFPLCCAIALAQIMEILQEGYSLYFVVVLSKMGDI